MRLNISNTFPLLTCVYFYYSDPLLYIGPSTITQPQDGIRLFYDITFPIGRLHVTLLTFVNACYEGIKKDFVYCIIVI